MDLNAAPSAVDGDIWINAGQALLPDAIALRRAIHADPEIGLDCPRTSAKIRAALEGLPLEIHEGPSTTGLMAILRGSANGRTVLLRGDMDALPLNEDTGLEFGSKNDGAMHACGHDTHVAMLVGAAKALCAERDRLSGTVMFIFQPGEEGYHGARFMIEDGLLADPKPDAAFALHVSPNVPSGIFAGRTGPLLASADVVQIKVRGAGGMVHLRTDGKGDPCSPFAQHRQLRFEQAGDRRRGIEPFQRAPVQRRTGIPLSRAASRQLRRRRGR